MNRKHVFAISLLLAVLLPAIGTLTTRAAGGFVAYFPVIARASGMAWREVGAGSASGGGGISNNAGDSRVPSLAVASDGATYAAWEDNTGGSPEIYVRTLNGIYWDEVGSGSASGGGISNTGTALAPSIAIAPDGTPYAAWEDYSNGNAEIYVRAWDGSSWAEVGAGSASGGGISNNAGYSNAPSIAIAPDGMPYVAWADSSSGFAEIYVRAWDGSTWAEVGAGSASGGGISNTGYAYAPSIAIAPDGTPYLSWADSSSGNNEIYMRRWDGSTWVEVGTGSASGGGISNTGIAIAPSIAVAPDGKPYVVWENNSGGDAEIYVRTWDGSNWVEVGAGSASGGGISDNIGESNYPSIGIAPDGTPYVAWEDYSNDWNAEIYVRTWDGGSWVEVGAGSASGAGISNDAGSTLPFLAIAPDGAPYTAWQSGGGEIYMRAWDGFGWAEVGVESAGGLGISNNPGSSSDPSLAFAPDGKAYAAWEDDSGGNPEIFVRAWHGGNWVEVGAGSASGGGISRNAGTSSVPSIAIAPDGKPYAAWADDTSGDYEIYIRAWDGNNWVEVGTGSASGGGISNTAGTSFAPSMAVAPDGTPYAAWTVYSGGGAEIYVRAWDGSAWAEVGAGSASGGGISNTARVASAPSLAIAADGTPYAAWADDSTGDWEIYVRSWNGVSWAEVGTGSASGGGISSTAAVSAEPTVALAPDGTPYVAWAENFNGIREIYIRAWDGSSWVEVGLGSASGGGISNSPLASFEPSIAVAPDGRPYAAWTEYGGGSYEIHVRAWDGSSWAEVGAGSASGGGISNTPAYSFFPSLAIAPDGTPYVVWMDDDASATEIYARRFSE